MGALGQSKLETKSSLPIVPHRKSAEKSMKPQKQIPIKTLEKDASSFDENLDLSNSNELERTLQPHFRTKRFTSQEKIEQFKKDRQAIQKPGVKNLSVQDKEQTKSLVKSSIKKIINKTNRFSSALKSEKQSNPSVPSGMMKCTSGSLVL